MYLQNRNGSDSSDDVVKIADHLGCLRWGVHTGRKNPRRRKIVKILDSYISEDKWEPSYSTCPVVSLSDKSKRDMSLESNCKINEKGKG